jgi:hypothetical protein
VISVVLSLLLLVGTISPTSHLVRDIREVRGDTILTSQILNRMAAARVGVPNHDGLGEACPRTIDGRTVTLCGEIKGWTSTAGLDRAVDWVVPAWMASRPHHRIILGRWRWVGVAVRRIGDRTWLVADFAR